MTVEELLKPRYRVIADYPHNPYKIGDLLEQFTETAYKLTVTYNGNSIEDSQANTYPASAVESYPHLFKKLEWWEERTEEDMPEYLKHTLDGDTTYHKIIRWDIKKVFAVEEETDYWIRGCDFLLWNAKFNYQPATKEEYEQYKTKVA